MMKITLGDGCWLYVGLRLTVEVTYVVNAIDVIISTDIFAAWMTFSIRSSATRLCAPGGPVKA